MIARRQRTIVVVAAGLSTPSSTRLLADRLATASTAALREAGIDARTEVIELRDHAQDLTNHLLTGFPSPRLKGAIDAVLAADGLIAVSPIFSASYSGLFKMFFDVVERDGLAAMPVLIGATGGTARHSLALEHAFRPLFAYLNAAVVATSVFAASEDWAHGDGPAEAPLTSRIDRAAAEFASAVAGRPRRTTADPYADPIPFEQLLSGK